MTIEGAGQTVQGTANDQGGNTASTSVTISLDKTPPIVTPNIQPLANGAGWHKADATVSFDCADNFMGITFCTPPITITTEGAGQTVQGTAQDWADNMTTASAKVSLDKTPPLVTITSPSDGASIDGKTAHVEGTVADALSGVTSVSCNGVAATVSGSVFNCEIPLQNGGNTLIAQATDAAGNSSSSGINVTMSNAEIKITEPANFSFFNINAVTVSGTVAAGTTGVTVNGIPATLSAGNWSASIPLQEGNNTLTALAVKTGGAVNTASIQVTLDTTPPRVTVAAPIDGFKTTEDIITVTAIVNDIVVGTVNSGQAQVTVNNIAAQVANRTYTAADIPLQTGLNTIQVIGRDQVGNSATTTIKVTREAVSAPFIKLLSGNNQTGAIATTLTESLVVQLLNGEAPVANTPVIFKITENDGYLQFTNGRKLQLIAVNTDAEGKAQAMLTLGNRAGAGNNVVEAYATGYQGMVLFTASGTPSVVANINVDAGANQFGAVNNSLPLPFVAVVTDAGHNRLGGVPVTFTVTQGGGNINGQASYETVSDSDGRVLAVLSLGPEAGQDNNVVEAGFPGNSGFAAAFSASGKMPGDPAQTAISGVVQDNSNNPIPGVTLRLLQLHLGSSNNQPVEVATPTVTDANGQFKLAPAPVGFFKLMADGATATQTDKRYPALEYDIVTVAGQDNGVGMPIYLPALDRDAKLCVDAQTGGTLKMASSPGFSLTLAPGATTFPGGSKSGCVSVTPVNPDKVPMVPGFGQQPRYVVTIQPVGTTFNPPAAITIPNMDGLAPHAKTEMYSYDHDLAAFVAIGSGTVSADGSVIASDPGIGVMKAGWHCGGDPNTPGSAGHCPTCQKCQGSQCIADSAKDRQACTIASAQSGVCEGGQCNPLGQLELAVPADNTIFNISAQPNMPDIVARAQILDVSPDPTSMSPFNWDLSIQYTDPNGRSTSGQYQATSVVGGRWSPYTAASATIRGGDGVFEVSAQRAGQTLSDRSVGVRILGTNPTRAAVNTLLGGFPATNIACWESLHRLAQFDANGLPLFGGPNGYGIMQVDNPPVSDDGIWNWRQNVQEGLVILAQKRQDAIGYPGRVQNQLPSSQVPDFCALGTIDSQTGQSYCDLETIQRYNGGAYWRWNNTNHIWERSPPNDYVTNVLNSTCN